MSYSITQHLTKINKGEKGDNKPEWIIFHFVGASGQAWDNARYFYSMYRGASAHYFVDENRIYQVVEDDTPAWHVGDGNRTRKGGINGYVHPGGATNTNSIGIEVCQDITTGKDVWNWDFHPEALNKAEWLIRQLQKKYNIDDDHVIRHFDATGKACPGNWKHNNWEKWWDFKKRLEKDIKQVEATLNNAKEGKLPDDHMYLVNPGDTLYSIAKAHKVSIHDLVKWNDLENPTLIFPETKLFVSDPNVKNYPAASDIEKMAKDVLAGKYGNGEDRKAKLGDQYDAVQLMINSMLLGRDKLVRKPVVKQEPRPEEVRKPIVKEEPKPEPKRVKTIDELAREVIDGKHGSGAERKKNLGSNYEFVQKRVNELLMTPNNPVKTIDELADEVMIGLHGSGRERMISLGSNYAKVQMEVNRRLRNK